MFFNTILLNELLNIFISQNYENRKLFLVIKVDSSLVYDHTIWVINSIVIKFDKPKYLTGWIRFELSFLSVLNELLDIFLFVWSARQQAKSKRKLEKKGKGTRLASKLSPWTFNQFRSCLLVLCIQKTYLYDFYF